MVSYKKAIKEITKHNITTNESKAINLFDVSFILSLVFDKDKLTIIEDLRKAREKQTKEDFLERVKWIRKRNNF